MSGARQRFLSARAGLDGEERVGTQDEGRERLEKQPVPRSAGRSLAQQGGRRSAPFSVGPLKANFQLQGGYDRRFRSLHQDLVALCLS